MPPNFISAFRPASAAFMPARRLSSMCIWRWLSISTEKSRSCRALRNNPPNRNSHALICLIIMPHDNGRSEDRPLQLFVTQRHHGIDAHSAPRREVARGERNGSEQNRHACKCERIRWPHAVQQVSHEPRQGEGSGQAKHHSDSSEPRALAKKQTHNLAALRAESNTDADFARSLRHAIRHYAINPYCSQRQCERRE